MSSGTYVGNLDYLKGHRAIDDDGKQLIEIADVGSAETQAEIDDWIEESIRTRPWGKTE